MSKHRPYCLSIAGFDPSGGAGIIADAKVFEHFKTQGLFVQTCNTLQTEEKLSEIRWESSEWILKQLELQLNRYSPAYVKIGLIEGPETLDAILQILNKKDHVKNIIWDPIFGATNGQKFSSDRFNHVNPKSLKKVILTPNWNEAKALPDVIQDNSLAVYHKGGDNPSKRGVDKLKTANAVHSLNPQIQTENTFHGTGCHFSSALTAHLSNGYPLLKSCLRSKRFVEKLLKQPQGLLAKIKN